VIDEAGYQPWFEPLWTPPSKEIESLLFSLQAALGAGLLGYYFGLRRGRGEGRKERRGELHAGD
jgi:cobalt/nickel transport protein